MKYMDLKNLFEVQKAHCKISDLLLGTFFGAMQGNVRNLSQNRIPVAAPIPISFILADKNVAQSPKIRLSWGNQL